MDVYEYDILDITPKEMDDIIAVRNEMAHILKNHSAKTEKKEYLSDATLKRAWIILSVFTRDCSSRPASEFDTFVDDSTFNDRIEAQLSGH